MASRLGDGPEPVEGRPGALGVDVIGRDRRDASPVVDPGVQQRREVVAQVGWGLEVDGVGQDQPGQGDGPPVGLVGARLVFPHGGARLRQEVLDDHFLHVAVAGVGVGDGLECLDAVGFGFADPDENAGGEGDAELAGRLERRQTAGRDLVGGVRVSGEVGPQRFDHHALARRDRAEPGELVGVERAGVGVGEEAGFVEHQLAHRHQVLHRRGVSPFAQPGRGLRIAEFGTLAEREERLVAAGAGATLGDPQHLGRFEEGGVEPGRRLGEGAVAALVAAQHGERDEHLGRERHPIPVGVIAPLPGPGQEFVGREVREFGHGVGAFGKEGRKLNDRGSGFGPGPGRRTRHTPGSAWSARAGSRRSRGRARPAAARSHTTRRPSASAR